MKIKMTADFQSLEAGTVFTNMSEVTGKMLIRKGVAKALDGTVLDPVIPEPMGEKVEPQPDADEPETEETVKAPREAPTRKVKPK